jgi:hypothetical protein
MKKRFSIPSVPFFNLKLDILLNLQEKFYQCINFGARCNLEPKRPFVDLLFTADYLYSRRNSFFFFVTTIARLFYSFWDLIKN